MEQVRVKVYNLPYSLVDFFSYIFDVMNCFY